MIIVSTTTAATRVKRVFNFNAGPAALPLPVLERIREELLDYRGTGMSVMELSHRSAEFEAVNTAAEQNLRKLLAIPEEYAVIFVQGGGSMQFTMVPMNLCLSGKPVDVLHTGAWTAKAIGELQKGIPHHIAASTEAERFVRVPRTEEIKLSEAPRTPTSAPTTPLKARNITTCRPRTRRWWRICRRTSHRGRSM